MGNGEPLVDDSSQPESVSRKILVDGAGNLLGNLLTAAVLYLVLVVGDVVTPSAVLITLAIVVAILGIGTALSLTLWIIGARTNGYTQSISGKKGVIVAIVAVPVVLLLAALLVLVYLAAQKGLA